MLGDEREEILNVRVTAVEDALTSLRMMVVTHFRLNFGRRMDALW
jgi:hypothetical protein